MTDSLHGTKSLYEPIFCHAVVGKHFYTSFIQTRTNKMFLNWWTYHHDLKRIYSNLHVVPGKKHKIGRVSLLKNVVILIYCFAPVTYFIATVNHLQWRARTMPRKMSTSNTRCELTLLLLQMLCIHTYIYRIKRLPMCRARKWHFMCLT